MFIFFVLVKLLLQSYADPAQLVLMYDNKNVCVSWLILIIFKSAKIICCLMKKLFALLLVFQSFLFLQAQNDSLGVRNSTFDFQYQKLYVPVGLMGSGLIVKATEKQNFQNGTENFNESDLLGFENHLEDYAQFAPFAALYGFEWLGMKPKTDWKNRTAIMMKGQILNLGMVYLLKKIVKGTRPDGTGYSFPSGHTANVFAGATILSIEYGENHKWVPYAAYGVATGVGIMRISNEKHHLSDVLFGAGLGILSMKVAYWTHQYKWNRNKSDKDVFAGTIY